MCIPHPTPPHSALPHPSFHTLPSSLCPPQHQVTSQITRTGCSANPLWEPRCLCFGPNSPSASFLLALQTSLHLYHSTQHSPSVLLSKECYIHCGEEYHSFSSWLMVERITVHHQWNIVILWFFRLFLFKKTRKNKQFLNKKNLHQTHVVFFFFWIIWVVASICRFQQLEYPLSSHSIPSHWASFLHPSLIPPLALMTGCVQSFSRFGVIWPSGAVGSRCRG